MRWVWLVVALVAVLVGCGKDKPLSAQSDVRAYSEKMIALVDEEKAILTAYENVTGTNYTTDARTHAVISDLIPKTRAFIGKIESIIPPAKARSIHEKYISAWNLQYDAFVLIVTALARQDATLIVQANGKLSEARRLVREVIAEINALR